MNEIVVVKKSNAGRPPLYDERFHIKLLYDTFMNGEGIVAFCADANISVETFHQWKRKYRNFREAYKICLPKGARISEREAKLSGKDLNFISWKFGHMNKFSEVYQKFPKLKDDSIETKLKAAYKALENGNITPQEYNQIVSSFAKVKELELQAKQLELNAKELEQQAKSKMDVSNVPDHVIEAYWLLKEGKAKIVMMEDKE